jgi:cytoskeletal protein CcmA (bactofilin family)
MRKARDGNALQPEAASSISSGLSVVGKIIGDGALTIFGHVEGEVRASTIVIAEGAHIEGKVSAEELTIGGYVKGVIHANRVKLNSTAVVKGRVAESHGVTLHWQRHELRAGCPSTRDMLVFCHRVAHV